MKLHWSPRSPFVGKVMIVAHERGLVDRLSCVRTVAAMTTPHAELMRDNPLSKIPTLVLDDGTVLYDSPVICEYLDALDGKPQLFPRDREPRMLALRRQVLGEAFSISWCSRAMSDCARRLRKSILTAPRCAARPCSTALSVKRKPCWRARSTSAMSRSAALWPISISDLPKRIGANATPVLPAGRLASRRGRRSRQRGRSMIPSTGVMSCERT
jgi:Glutathione S-transferase, N-terminal domain